MFIKVGSHKILKIQEQLKFREKKLFQIAIVQHIKFNLCCNIVVIWKNIKIQFLEFVKYCNLILMCIQLLEIESI